MSRWDRLAPWTMLCVAMLAQIGCSYIHQGLPTLAPLFQAEWALTRAELGVLLGAINVGVLLASVAAGQLVDRVGERGPLAAGPAGTGALALLAALSPTSWLLTLALVLVGVSTAAMTPAGGKAMLLWFTSRVRGVAMSLRQTAIPIAGVLAALTLPLLAEALGWRAALVAGGLFSALLALVVGLLYRDPPARGPAPPREGLGLAAIPHLLRDRSLAATFALGPILVVGQWAVVPYLGLFLYERFGWSVVEAAAYLAVAQVGAIVGRIFWGAASDVFWRGRRKPALALILPLGASGMFALALLPPTTPGALVALLAFALGFTTIGWNGVLLAYTAEQAGPHRAGTALGLGLTTVFLGAVLAPPAFGWLVDRAGSYTPAWAAVGGVLLAGLLLFPLLREVARD